MRGLAAASGQPTASDLAPDLQRAVVRRAEALVHCLSPERDVVYRLAEQAARWLAGSSLQGVSPLSLRHPVGADRKPARRRQRHHSSLVASLANPTSILSRYHSFAPI